jgi:uncharacterized membrane protein
MGDDPWISRHLGKLLLGLVIAAVAAAATATVLYAYRLGTLPIDAQGWGQLGDYFGGLLNPVFGFLTILAFVFTLLLQSRELKLSREELELSRTELAKSAEALHSQNQAIDRQNFEQTFFSWLDTYGDLLDSIELSYTTKSSGSGGSIERILRDRRALMRWWSNRLTADLVWDQVQHQITGTTARSTSATAGLKALTNDQQKIVSHAALKGWLELYDQIEFQIDSLFRILYRLILWIDSQDDERLSMAQKWLYITIVRARLSWIELVYLFYNGHTDRGINFKRLAEKYALFDNLNFGSDLIITIMRSFPPDGVGYGNTAYDSAAARQSCGLPASSEQTLAMASDL